MAKKEKTIYTGYYPRPLQDKLHRSLKTFNVIVCHRRFGKTIFSLNELIDKALRCEKRNPQYAYIGPTYGSVKRVAWDPAKEYTKGLPGVETNEQDLRIEIPRAHMGDKIKILLLGAENPGSLRGIYLDGVILDEFAECDPTIWSQVVSPALSDRGGWAIFIGTPKGMNGFFDVYEAAGRPEAQKDWFRCMYKASETKILTEAELDRQRLNMSEEEYEQEFECSFGAALIGSYYAKQMQRATDEKRITQVPYDRAVCVDTFWDLGIGDTTAIWFAQVVGKEYHIIDHLEASGAGLEWYVKQIKDKPYIYGEHVVPHDAAARELGTGKTRVETLQNYGLGRIRVLERAQDVDDEIHACRMILDKCWFDSIKCERGLKSLKNYERKWDAKQKIFSAKPLHNWASHSADAFRVFAMGVRGPGGREVALPKQADNDYDIFAGAES